ncbi:MAG: hypothetical protein JW943_10425 [Deltaproteobacteria bacterium]|nr:hypothetical protein [Deltaproteobacteria bacterium]
MIIIPLTHDHFSCKSCDEKQFVSDYSYYEGVVNSMKVLKMKYGATGAQVDSFGMRFYGNFDSKIESLGSINEIFSDSEEPPVTKNKRVTIWYTLERIRPYGKVSGLLDEIVTMLKNEGYVVIHSSLDELADTTSPEYTGKTESRFAAPERMHIYNAAGGFSVTAEKADSKSKFTLAEIEMIRDRAIKFGRLVYGRTLKKVDEK